MDTETDARQTARDAASDYGESCAYGQTPDGQWIIAPDDRTGLYGRDWLAFGIGIGEVDGETVATVTDWTTVEPGKVG